LLPENPYDGDYAFWSNKGDESDMRLTHTFDFTSVSDNITLSYWTWYDIEVGYDYAYLLVSEDGNQWDIIQTPLSTIENPTGNNYGWGYNGVSGSWIEEKIDLSSYAGKQVDIRFEYVTDAAVNGEGFLIDQVSIPAIGYETSFEENDGGGVAEGFIRISNPLPQVFAVSLVSLTTQPQIEKVDIKSANINQIPVQISNDGDLLVVISGTTRYTRQLAYYRYRLVETQ
jgi:hypothetical protein